MVYGHPTSTFFPYTTLFRSVFTIDREAGRPRERVDCLIENGAAGEESGLLLGPVKQLLLDFKRAPLRHAMSRLDHRDRKSTRLNSSHLGISYAVFCLKKKKK